MSGLFERRLDARILAYDVMLKTTSRVFQLTRCTVCRSLFLNPPPTEAEIPGFYPRITGGLRARAHSLGSRTYTGGLRFATTSRSSNRLPRAPVMVRRRSGCSMSGAGRAH